MNIIPTSYEKKLIKQLLTLLNNRSRSSYWQLERKTNPVLVNITCTNYSTFVQHRRQRIVDVDLDHNLQNKDKKAVNYLQAIKNIREQRFKPVFFGTRKLYYKLPSEVLLKENLYKFRNYINYSYSNTRQNININLIKKQHKKSLYWFLLTNGQSSPILWNKMRYQIKERFLTTYYNKEPSIRTNANFAMILRYKYFDNLKKRLFTIGKTLPTSTKAIIDKKALNILYVQTSKNYFLVILNIYWEPLYLCSFGTIGVQKKRQKRDRDAYPNLCKWFAKKCANLTKGLTTLFIRNRSKKPLKISSIKNLCTALRKASVRVPVTVIFLNSDCHGTPSRKEKPRRL